MQCVILAGGLGTRLGAAAGAVPKHLAPVAGRPFADHQLARLVRQGVDDVVYSIGHGGDQIRRHVTRHRPEGLRVRFVDEHDRLMGTGGALRLALAEGVLDDRFLVLYGDTLLDVDLRAVVAAFEASGCPALITVYRNRGAFDRSNATFDGRFVTYDKHRPTPDMEWIDYGLSVLTPGVLEAVEPGKPEDLAVLLHDLGRSGRLAGFEATNRFHEIGTPESLAELDALLRSGEVRA